MLNPVRHIKTQFMTSTLMVPLADLQIVACLAGGRNKITAAKAYESFNNEISDTTMAIRTPETFVNVAKEEIPSLVALFGGHAALKVPYSNRGFVPHPYVYCSG